MEKVEQLEKGEHCVIKESEGIETRGKEREAKDGQEKKEENLLRTCRVIYCAS